MTGGVVGSANGGGGGRCTQFTSPEARTLQSDLDAAVRSGAPAFTVAASPAPICFGNASLLVERATNLAVDLGGNAMVFAVGGGVLIRDSVGVTLAGATISYDPPTAAQGVIASTFGPSDNRTTLARVVLDPRFGAVTNPEALCLLWGPGDEVHPEFGD